MSKLSERERRRIATTRQRHGKDIFKRAGSNGGTATWTKIRKALNKGAM